MNSVKKLLPPITGLLAFLLGAYIWNISNTSRTISVQSQTNELASANPIPSILVEIEDDEVSRDDLEFEYQLLVNKIFDNDDLTPIPDLGDRYESELNSLKEKIIDSLVERKILFQFIKQDTNFDVDNPSRYVSCVEEWMKIIKVDLEILRDSNNQQRLKERLCQQSILLQYLDEKIYAKIGISQSEIVEYFKNHSHEFTQPPMVKIRQIVLADEKQANQIKAKVNLNNFSDLARQYSIAPEASSGGELGPFRHGGMPRFFDVVFSMKPGQISGILKSTYGFHIIILDRFYEAKRLGLEEATPHIEKLLKKQKREKEYQKWVDLALHSVNVSTPKVKW